MRRLVVLRQQIQAEVAFEVAPHAVDVVGVVLRLVELDEKRLQEIMASVETS